MNGEKPLIIKMDSLRCHWVSESRNPLERFWRLPFMLRDNAFNIKIASNMGFLSIFTAWGWQALFLFTSLKKQHKSSMEKLVLPSH